MTTTLTDWLPTPDTSVLDAAIAYASQGWPVIPVHGLKQDGSCTCHLGARCPNKGKHPVEKAWASKAATTADEARDKFRAHVGNIGLAIPRHCVVIDVDGAIGEATVAEWNLPPTIMAFSGSGTGRHLIYQMKPGQSVPKNRRVAPGVDCKTHGGQIVVAPSRHAAGNVYQWAPLIPIAILPDWLYELVIKSKPAPEPLRAIEGGRSVHVHVGGYVRATIEGVCDDIQAAAAGTRNNTLFSKATHAFEVVMQNGQETDEAHAEIRQAALSAGLDTEEIDKTLASALATARQSPASMVSLRVPTIPPPPATGDVTDWRSELETDERGRIKKSYANVVAILRHATDLAWNTHLDTPEYQSVPMHDGTVGYVREVVLGRGYGLDVSGTMAWDAIVQVALERRYSPVRRYLDQLTWDCVPRIGRVLSAVMGHASPADTDQAMLRAWFISAVARAQRPGCKADSCLVLYGEQNLHKSTFFAILAAPWFVDTRITIDKDGPLRLLRSWITEIPEIDQWTTSYDAAKIKAFMTSQEDVVRRPYGKITESMPRHSVFAGTTNESSFLTRETGTRRFWTIRVPSPIDRELLREWKDQLWAEAQAAYAAGEPWWLSREAESVRITSAAEFVTEDPLVETIAPLVAAAPAVFQTPWLLDRLDIRNEQRSVGLSRRIGKALRALGWDSRMVRDNGNLIKAWVRMPTL